MSSDLPPPGVVTAQDKAEMERFKNILEGFNQNTEGMTPSASAPRTANIAPPAFGPSGGVDADPAMGNFAEIVGNLYGGNNPQFEKVVTEAAQTLNESHDPEIQEALETKKTNTGVRIGKWEIVSRIKKYNLKEEKVFDVVRPSTKETIADSLSVYEAAHALVRYLNKGYTINSYEIKEVLDLEEKFFSQREDAKLYKIKSIRAARKGDEQKSFIMEDRFEYAKEQARGIKKRLVEANKRSLRS